MFGARRARLNITVGRLARTMVDAKRHLLGPLPVSTSVGKLDLASHRMPTTHTKQREVEARAFAPILVRNGASAIVNGSSPPPSEDER